MKYLLFLATLITGMDCYGQKITGVVIDKATKQPVVGAAITLSSVKTSTNFQGLFEIELGGVNDSLKVAHFGYKTYKILLSKITTTVHIELEPTVISLKEVTVHSNREADFKKDSIENRMAYAKQFNYKGPTIMDAFTGSVNKQPCELISVNPFILIAAFTKKSTPEYKFNKILLRDEQAEYVDRKFNRGIVSQITGLKGDTLLEFLVNYRPTYQFAKKATDYDMEVYIKDCLKKLEKDGIAASNPFAKH